MKFDPGLLTEPEHAALDLTAELWHAICAITGDAPETRSDDLREIAHHVHAIQNHLLAQAAARAYPYLYRPLGGVALRSETPNASQT